MNVPEKTDFQSLRSPLSTESNDSIIKKVILDLGGNEDWTNIAKNLLSGIITHMNKIIDVAEKNEKLLHEMIQDQHTGTQQNLGN